MRFKRSNRQTLVVALNLLMVAVLAIWFLKDAWRLGGALNWLLAGLCVLWAGLILSNLLRRHVPVILHDDGLTIRKLFGTVRLRWDMLQWASVASGRPLVFFAYRREDDVKDKYAGIPQRLLGADAVTVIGDAVKAARPNLPESDLSARPRA